MKLIFIHGSPAVGKLSVAKELSKRTSYKIFHNHLTMDLVNSIFEQDTKISWKIIKKFRLSIFKFAAKTNIKGLIFTFSDVSADKFKFVKQTINIVEKYRGKVYFVHLFCNEKELNKRVVKNSRKAFKKIRDVQKLKEVRLKWDFHTINPFKETLQIDSTKLSVKQVADKIEDYYEL